MIKKLILNFAFFIAEYSYYFSSIELGKIIAFLSSPIKAISYPFKAIKFYSKALKLERKTLALFDEIKAKTDFDFDTIRKSDVNSLLYAESAYSLLVKYEQKIETLKLESTLLLENEQFNQSQMFNELSTFTNQTLDTSKKYIKNIAETIILVEKKHRKL